MMPNLFDHADDTDNFAELVKLAEGTGAIDAATCASIRVQITAVAKAYRVAKKIRNKVVAHQDDIQRKPEIYRQE
jgi:hypothetical protein